MMIFTLDETVEKKIEVNESPVTDNIVIEDIKPMTTPVASVSPCK